MKCFDIEVFENDIENGNSSRREVGVFAPNRQALVGIYDKCGERIRIIREYESDAGTAASQEKAPGDAGTGGNTPAKKTEPATQEKAKVDSKPAEVPPPTKNIPAKAVLPSGSDTPVPVKQPAKPKFFSVAGIECKMENGKVYQKQWVKLLGQSASNYRLISDKNNREIPLVGKHLEVLKWVSVEDEEQEQLNSSILSILNG